jgi:hypothetical protein
MSHSFKPQLGLTVALIGLVGCAESFGSDAGIEAGPDSGVPAECQPRPGVRIVSTDPVCECPPDEAAALHFLEADEPAYSVCSGAGTFSPCHCAWGLRCAEGLVCFDPVFSVSVIASPKACLYYHERSSLGSLPATACRYADLTQAMTGELAAVECTSDLTDAGLCAVGCPCPDEMVCYGVSETHAVGACIEAYRGEPPACDPAGVRPADCTRTELPLRCLTPVERPPWIAEPPWAAPATDAGMDIVGGVCVHTPTCDALAARYPDTWRCLETPLRPRP